MAELKVNIPVPWILYENQCTEKNAFAPLQFLLRHFRPCHHPPRISPAPAGTPHREEQQEKDDIIDME